MAQRKGPRASPSHAGAPVAVNYNSLRASYGPMRERQRGKFPQSLFRDHARRFRNRSAEAGSKRAPPDVPKTGAALCRFRSPTGRTRSRRCGL
jgi:hypothetical protein